MKEQMLLLISFRHNFYFQLSTTSCPFIPIRFAGSDLFWSSE